MQRSFPLTTLVAFIAPLLTCTGTILAKQLSPEPSSEASIPADPEQIASLIGVSTLVSQLRGLPSPLTLEDSWKSLYLRQQILESIISATLQVDAATARIESEIAQADDFRGSLMDRRDRKEDRLNLAGIGTGGALGVVSSALQISPKHAKAGNSVGIGAGVIVTVISVMSLRTQNGQAQLFHFRSNMLAKVFDRPTDFTDTYSPAVLTFLDTVPAIDPDKLTRRQRLIRTWIEVGRLNGSNSTEDQTKIAHLTGSYAHEYKLTINELDDRQAMLRDLGAKLSLMKRDLGFFMTSLPKMPPLNLQATHP